MPTQIYTLEQQDCQGTFCMAFAKSTSLRDVWAFSVFVTSDRLAMETMPFQIVKVTVARDSERLKVIGDF